MTEFRLPDPVPVRAAMPLAMVTGNPYEGRSPVPGYRAASGGRHTGQPAARYSRPAGMLVFLLLCIGALGSCAVLGGREAAPVTVPEIIQMSRQGVPTGQIVERMRLSGTTYRLQASQLASLHRQGVADSVIDYMQQTYLDADRTRQERADLDYWSEVDGWWYGGGPWDWSDDDNEHHAARDTD